MPGSLFRTRGPARDRFEAAEGAKSDFARARGGTIFEALRLFDVAADGPRTWKGPWD